MNEPQTIADMLALRSVTLPAIAVVGLSDDPSRPSYRVSQYMQRSGYTIFPVNPSIATALGETSYASLADLPQRPGFVNVFRLPRAIPAIVNEMIALKLDKLWVQQGIVHAEAAARAEAAGIAVVMDRCVMVEHARLIRW
jgi:predicted CoA-binding protein